MVTTGILFLGEYVIILLVEEEESQIQRLAMSCTTLGTKLRTRTNS